MSLTASTKRREHAVRKTAIDGRALCSCGCGQHPAPPRRNWFSDACVQNWRAVNDPAFIREKLLARDKGICALCGVNCEVEFRRWCESRREVARFIAWLENGDRWQRDWNEKAGRMEFRKAPPLPYSKIKLRRDELWAQWGPPGNWTSGRSSGWDADHIVPVVEGGGLCGLENYRTLCHPCHKSETKALAARRAAAKCPSPAPSSRMAQEVLAF